MNKKESKQPGHSSDTESSFSPTADNENNLITDAAEQFPGVAQGIGGSQGYSQATQLTPNSGSYNTHRVF